MTAHDPTHHPSVIHVDAFMERIGADNALAKEMIALFLRDLPALLAQIDRGLSAQDARTVERAAHALKGAVANFAAQPATDAAACLELLARKNIFDHADAAMAALRFEMSRVETALQQLAERL